MQDRVLCGIRPSFPGLSHSTGQVTHVLLTRSPLTRSPKQPSPFDLHVLSTPPAFVLSQDQTLQTKIQTHKTTQRNPDKGFNKKLYWHKFSTLLSSQTTHAHPSQNLCPDQ